MIESGAYKNCVLEIGMDIAGACPDMATHGHIGINQKLEELRSLSVLCIS